MTHGVILALLAESPPMEIRMRERFHRFANGLFRSNIVSIIVHRVLRMLHYVILFRFLVIIVSL